MAVTQSEFEQNMDLYIRVTLIAWACSTSLLLELRSRRCRVGAPLPVCIYYNCTFQFRRLLSDYLGNWGPTPHVRLCFSGFGRNSLRNIKFFNIIYVIYCEIGGRDGIFKLIRVWNFQKCQRKDSKSHCHGAHPESCATRERRRSERTKFCFWIQEIEQHLWFWYVFDVMNNEWVIDVALLSTMAACVWGSAPSTRAWPVYTTGAWWYSMRSFGVH